MKNVPLPSTIRGWNVAIILILISFFLYYHFLFDKIITAYYHKDNFKTFTSTTENLEITVLIPQSISRFDTRELQLTVLAKETTEKNVIISIKTEQLSFCNERPTSSSICYQGQGVLEFGSFVKGWQKSNTIWIVTAPRITDERFKLTFEISFCSPSVCESKPLNFSGKSEIPIDNSSVLISSLIGTLLLPPWSNGLIPSLALLIVSLNEHKIQPKQKNNKQKNKLGDWFSQNTATFVFSILYLICFFIIPFCLLSILPIFGYEIDFMIIIVSFFLIPLIMNILESMNIFESSEDSNSVQTSVHANESSSSSFDKLLTELGKKLDEVCKALEHIGSANQSELSRLSQQVTSLTNAVTTPSGLPEKADKLIQQVTRLTDIVANLRDKLSPARAVQEGSAPIDRRSPLDHEYNCLSLLHDDGLISLFKQELPHLSAEQFQNKLKDEKFAKCMLSLFVRALKDDWDDLPIANRSLRGWIKEPVFWDQDIQDSSIFTRWLDDLHKSDRKSFKDAMERVFEWMLKAKTDQVDKYLFNIFPQKYTPEIVIPLLAKYLDIYQKEAPTNINWSKVLDYILNTAPLRNKEAPTEIRQILYPFNDKPLWEIANEHRTFSVEKWKEVYTKLLEWLCVIQDETLVGKIGLSIFQFYKDDGSLEPNTQLGKFVQACIQKAQNSNTEISDQGISKVRRSLCRGQGGNLGHNRRRSP